MTQAQFDKAIEDRIANHSYIRSEKELVKCIDKLVVKFWAAVACIATAVACAIYLAF